MSHAVRTIQQLRAAHRGGIISKAEYRRKAACEKIGGVDAPVLYLPGSNNCLHRPAPGLVEFAAAGGPVGDPPAIEPACETITRREKQWRVGELETMRPWRDLCAHCFDDDPGSGGGATS